MIPHKKIDHASDFDCLYPGTAVYINGFPNQIFCITSIQKLFKSGEIPKVEVLTLDSKGVPHVLEVSPYCIVLPAEEEQEVSKQ
jgi:hypothetical protein